MRAAEVVGFDSCACLSFASIHSAAGGGAPFSIQISIIAI